MEKGVISLLSPLSSLLFKLLTMNEICKLNPECIWKNFYALTQVPRPSGHLEKVQQFLLDFAKKAGVEAFIDEGRNVVMRKPATPRKLPSRRTTS